MHPFDELVLELDENIRLYKEERAKVREAAGCANDHSSLLDDSPTDTAKNDYGVPDNAENFVSMNYLNDLSEAIHEVAVEKGWWPHETRDENGNVTAHEVAEKLLLIHTEVSEAVEDLRNTHYDALLDDSYGPDGKPLGFAIELADVLIRVLDLCAALDINISDCVAEKMNYNRTREFRHGGKRL